MTPNRRSVIEMTVGLLVIAGTVQAATFINTCPFVITSPGDYLLSADLGCLGGGTGITINSSHVTLKLEGHTISAVANMASAISNSSGGVNTPVTDVHILGPGLIFSFGGALGTFDSGVFLLGSVTESEVSGITVQRAVNGITADGQGSGLTVTKNTLAGGTVGITVAGFTSSTISENVVSGYTDGMDIVGVAGQPIVLSRNIVIGNPNTGVSIGGGFVTAQNNLVSGNGTLGIDVRASQPVAVEITNNTALANGLDLHDPVPNCPGTAWSGNTFFTANQSCIH